MFSTCTSASVRAIGTIGRRGCIELGGRVRWPSVGGGEGGPGPQTSPISGLGKPPNAVWAVSKNSVSASLAVAIDKRELSMAKRTFRLP